jgi:hypothetical protein
MVAALFFAFLGFCAAMSDQNGTRSIDDGHSVRWDSGSFAVNASGTDGVFQFVLTTPLNVVTLWVGMADGSGAGCAITNMRCFASDGTLTVYPLLLNGPLSYAFGADNFTITANLRQAMGNAVSATVTTFYFARNTTTQVGSRTLSDRDVKFSFDVQVPLRPECTWVLTTSWPFSPNTVLDARDPVSRFFSPCVLCLC